MATYEDIKRANNEAKLSPIKDKPYVEVNERIKAFRKVFPEGFIINNMISDENGVCVFRTEVGFYTENGDKRVLGTGTAYEKENSSFINKGSYIENCETSSCGRALGMAGFGIDVSVASAEEVANAIMNQNDDKSTENTQKPAKGQKAQQRTAQKSDEQKDAELKAKATEDPDVLMVEQGGSAVDKKRARVKVELERTGVNPATVLGAYKVNSVDEMNDAQLVSAISRLKKSKDKA